MNNQEIERLIDQRIAAAFRLTANIFDRQQEDPEPAREASQVVSMHTKQISRAIDPKPKKPRRDWRNEPFTSKRDKDQHNLYVILKDFYDVSNVFDARVAHKEALVQCSLQKLLGGLKKLEIEKLAVPTEPNRLMWVLLKA